MLIKYKQLISNTTDKNCIQSIPKYKLCLSNQFLFIFIQSIKYNLFQCNALNFNQKQSISTKYNQFQPNAIKYSQFQSNAIKYSQFQSNAINF